MNFKPPKKFIHSKVRLQLQLSNSDISLKLLKLISANRTPEPRTGKLEKVLNIFLHICLHYAEVFSARPPHKPEPGRTIW